MLEQFFNPKTIAVIGANGNPNKVGFALMKNLNNFQGNVIAINPKHDFVFNRPSYKSVRYYKGKIDLTIIAIPAPFVAGVLKECGKKGIKNVIIISAGFGEIGNNKMEKNVVDIAKKYKINLLGPNCFGITNPWNNLDTTFAKTSPKKGDIAFVSQSGALWSYIADFIGHKIGFSKFISLGNMAGISFADTIEYLSKDKKTKSIVLYIEKLKQGKRFLEACKKCKKPIFVVKAGKSKEGERAAISHTGSLATDYEVYKGVFKQAGVVLCDSLIDCFEKASKRKLYGKKPKKIKLDKKVLIVTNAGGAGALMADYCAEAGFKIIDVKDLLGTAQGEDYEKFFSRIRSKDLSVIVILTPQLMAEEERTAEAILGFQRLSGNKVIAFFLGDKSVSKASKILKESGIPCFNTLKDGQISLIK
jgi:acyl-CoA synthetase (NDP forming)